MIAAPVQCDVDGIPKGSHCVSVPPIEGLLFRLGAGIRRAASTTACAAASTTASVLIDGPTLAFDSLRSRFRHRPILVAFRRQRHLNRLVAGMTFIGQQDAAV